MYVLLMTHTTPPARPVLFLPDTETAVDLIYFEPIATALIDQRSPNIYGDGEQTRDFTYVANVVDGVLKACEAPKASGEIINVATGGRVSLITLYRTMRDIIGGTVEPIYLAARAGDVRDSLADITQARKCLGYEPSVTVDQGLRESIAYYEHSVTAR